MYIIWVVEELCSVLSLLHSSFVYFPTLNEARVFNYQLVVSEAVLFT